MTVKNTLYHDGKCENQDCDRYFGDFLLTPHVINNPNQNDLPNSTTDITLIIRQRTLRCELNTSTQKFNINFILVT
jgi:hypothetical protein